MIKSAVEKAFQVNNQDILALHIEEYDEHAIVSITYCANLPKQVQFRLLDNRIVTIVGETNIYILESINEYLGGQND